MFFNRRIYIFLVIFSEVSIYFCNSYVRHKARRRFIFGEVVPKTTKKWEKSEDYYSTETDDDDDKYNERLVQKKHCWLHVNSKNHFEVMDKLDESYADVRKEYQDAAQKDDFDGQILDVMVKTRGAAEREIQRVGGDSGLIPAGINMGGYFMMRMPNSLLFFHRMKLRNNTHFHVSYLHNDLMNLTLNAMLSLNDLHLFGSYDRCNTDKDPSILYYTPTYGQVEFLLKNVQYALEGRYRLLKDRLNIELIISHIDFDDIMMTYLNNKENKGIRLQRKNIEEFLLRLKSDLDKWIKDYFNDYLMYFGIVGKNSNDKFQKYDKERAKELNEYADRIIDLVTHRLKEVKLDSIKLPKFTIFSANGMELTLKDGVLRGLENMYRRSIATGKKEEDIRKIDSVVGFSNLKVIYQYEALLATNVPVLTGMIILSSDELTAHMQLMVGKDSDTVDIQFNFVEQAKPESLTIEGPANRMIANFKYLLEQHIIAIMTNTLHYNLRMLGSVTRCVPLLYSHRDSNITVDKVEVIDGNEESTPPNQDTVLNKESDNIINDEEDDQQANELDTSPASDNINEENLEDTEAINAENDEEATTPMLTDTIQTE